VIFRDLTGRTGASAASLAEPGKPWG
jgi:hypothetical protein